MRRGYRHPLVWAVLLLALGLALWPSAVLGTAAPRSEASVAGANAAPDRAAGIAEAGVRSGVGALTVDTHEGDDDHHRMWGDGWWSGGWWIVMVVLMVLFWGAVIGVVIWAITRFTPGRRGDEGRALDIAQERYARGEISREEFEQIRRDLQ